MEFTSKLTKDGGRYDLTGLDIHDLNIIHAALYERKANYILKEGTLERTRIDILLEKTGEVVDK